MNLCTPMTGTPNPVWVSTVVQSTPFADTAMEKSLGKSFPTFPASLRGYRSTLLTLRTAPRSTFTHSE